MADKAEQLAVVQRMLDAGESEENIATIIKHFKSQEFVGPQESVPAPAVQPHQLHMPADATISNAAPYSGTKRTPLDDFMPVPEGLAVEGLSSARSLLTGKGEQLAAGAGRLISHAADYVPSWAKPLKQGIKDAGGYVTGKVASREGLRVGRAVDEDIAATNRWQAQQGPNYGPEAEPPAHPTGSQQPKPSVNIQQGPAEPSRIIRPDASADWVMRSMSGLKGQLSPQEIEEIQRQNLMNFLRSGR